MTIYAIFEVHENEGWNDSDVDVLIGYAESEEAAIRLCNTENQQKIHDEQETKYNAWREKERVWNDANKHRFINVDQIKLYVEKHHRISQKLHNFNCSPPNLSKIPSDRHELIMARFNARKVPLQNELEFLSNKIKVSLNADVAQAINEALKKEREAEVGPQPEYPNFVYKRHYEAIEKLD